MINVKPHSDMQPVVTTHRHIAEDTLSQKRVSKLIQTAWKAFELRILAQIKANSFAVLTQILQLTSPLCIFGPRAFHFRCRKHCGRGWNGGPCAPYRRAERRSRPTRVRRRRLHSFHEVAIIEPIFKTWPAIVTRSVSLLSHPYKVTSSAITQPPMPPSRFRVRVSVLPHPSREPPRSLAWTPTLLYCKANASRLLPSRTRVRPSTTLRPPADPNLCNRTAA
jgi:hypothetical protein